MKIDNMRELYEELLRATSNGYRNRSIANPAVDFTKKAKAGDFDEMSDEEYYQALDKVNELNDVWQHRPSGQIGELLFTALENLTLSDSDVEDMAATLLCAYERSSKEHIPCDAKAADRNERTAGYAASNLQTVPVASLQYSFPLPLLQGNILHIYFLPVSPVPG